MGHASLVNWGKVLSSLDLSKTTFPEGTLDDLAEYVCWRRMDSTSQPKGSEGAKVP